MNDTINQNGVSSSNLSGHRHHGSIPNAPTRRDEPHGRNSSGLSNRFHQPVSDHDQKESERIQSRAVLLKLLQPPGNSLLRAQPSSCTLPYQQTDKTLLKSDLCGSHFLRRTDIQVPAHNSVDIGREGNDEWSQKTWHGNCINPEVKRQKQNISINRDATKSHVQDREAVVNLPCPGENLSRMDTDRTSLPPNTARCRGCEARARPFHSEEPQSRSDRCQHFPADRQQYSNGHVCFRKDTCTHDSNSVPYIAVQINKDLQRKGEGSQKQMRPPTWHYKGCDSWMCQRPPSNQTLEHEHPEMGVTGAGKPTILQNTERSPDHLSRPVESGKESTYQIKKRTHQGPSPTTQDKLEDHELNPSSSYSMCSSESYRCKPFFPSGELGSPDVRIVNGQEHRREEKNIRLERGHQTIPHSPREISSVIETQSDECTPVIVQCYSLSTVSSTLEPSSTSDSRFMNRREPYSSVNTSNNGDPTVLASHSRYLYQQHSPRSLKSANRLQSDEHFLYDSPVPGTRSNTNPHSHNFMTQPNHKIDESSTSELGVDDKEKQTRSAILPEQFHKSCAIPANCPCLDCQQGHRHAFKNGYDWNYSQTQRRDRHPYNDQWTEPHIKSSRNGSQQRIVHAPDHYQMTRSAVDFRNGHESGETFPNWHTRSVPRESRRGLQIHDYYEERRILVGTVYQNIPGSAETPHLNQTSTIPYAHTRQLQQKDPYQSAATSAEVFQPHAGEQSSLQICAPQPEIAVGSRKRKSRQPRPQREKVNGPALAREKYQHPIQHAEDRHKDFSHHNYHHQVSSSFQHDASLSKEASRKRREDVEVRCNESEVHAYEPVRESTDPSQHEMVTRHDNHVFKSNSAGPEFCRSEFPQESRSPRRTFVHEKRTNKVSIEQSEKFLQFPRGPLHVPCNGPVGRHDHANHIAREHQLNSYRQTKTPHKYLAYSNDNGIKRPFDPSPERNRAQQHRLGPIRMRDPENHYEALDSTNARCSSPEFVTYSGPSQHNMPTDESVATQFERNSESTWNVPATSAHGVHQGDRYYRHVASPKGKSPQSNSEMQLSLPSDNGYVSSTTVDDEVELQGKHDSDRPFHSVQATDSENRAMKEQDNRGLFLPTGEVWANYMEPAIKERKFVCRYCNKKFAHFSTLQNHLRTHTGDKPFQCKFCNRRFAQSGVLKAHLRTHTGDKPFPCMYCGKMFAQSTTLTNHLRTHTGHKPYVCQFCSKSFSQPSTLRKHELSHTKERPYPCKFCGKAFAQQSTLTNHLRSHTGQRPYKCHFCEKSFAQLSTLDRHLRLHSSVSLKPYQCRHCSKSFSYFSNLSSHMQSHEQEQA